MAMSEVNATSTLSYPEVCSEDFYILMHTFVEYVYINVGKHSIRYFPGLS